MPQNKDRLRYTKLFYVMLPELQLTYPQAHLLLVIEGLCKMEGYCYAAKSTLAKLLYVSEPTIYKALSVLEERELIFRENQDRKYNSGKIYITDKWQEYIDELRSPI